MNVFFLNIHSLGLYIFPISKLLQPSSHLETIIDPKEGIS